MKKLVFSKDGDKAFEVRIYDTGDEHNWVKYGELILNDKGNWELWTGVDYSSKGSGLKNSSDDCTKYTNDLDETFNAMALDLVEILEIF